MILFLFFNLISFCLANKDIDLKQPSNNGIVNCGDTVTITWTYEKLENFEEGDELVLTLRHNGLTKNRLIAEIDIIPFSLDTTNYTFTFPRPFPAEWQAVPQVEEKENNSMLFFLHKASNDKVNSNPRSCFIGFVCGSIDSSFISKCCEEGKVDCPCLADRSCETDARCHDDNICQSTIDDGKENGDCRQDDSCDDGLICLTNINGRKLCFDESKRAPCGPVSSEPGAFKCPCSDPTEKCEEGWLCSEHGICDIPLGDTVEIENLACDKVGTATSPDACARHPLGIVSRADFREPYSCQAGVCKRCIEGQLGCACFAETEECEESLECAGEQRRCYPTLGTLGKPCDRGVCNSDDLVCFSGMCQMKEAEPECTPGFETCPCAPADNGVFGCAAEQLACIGNQCIRKSNSTTIIQVSFVLIVLVGMAMAF